MGKIKEGMDIRLIVGAIENKTYAAVLEYISPKGVEEIQTLLTKLDLNLEG